MIILLLPGYLASAGSRVRRVQRLSKYRQQLNLDQIMGGDGVVRVIETMDWRGRSTGEERVNHLWIVQQARYSGPAEGRSVEGCLPMCCEWGWGGGKMKV